MLIFDFHFGQDPIQHCSSFVEDWHCCLQVQAELSKLDPYFEKLAEGMRAWIAAWDEINSEEANGKE